MATSVSTSSVNYPAASGNGSATSGRTIYRIVGIACIVGFFADVLVIGAPPSPMALNWRVEFLQQLGDRSIVFVIGVAFLMLGAFDLRKLLKQVALASMGMGLLLCLLVPLTIRDNLTLQKQVSNQIVAQASQVENQIQQIQSNPELKQKPSEDDLKRALAKVGDQSKQMQQNATKMTAKTGVSSASNLIVSGIALIGLGRYAMRRR
jgi:hypothetical protein